MIDLVRDREGKRVSPLRLWALPTLSARVQEGFRVPTSNKVGSDEGGG